MSAFDRIIGYASEKKDLMMLCDMLREPDVYTAMGAHIPHGALLRGDPGLGKTLMAQCLIEESGLTSYTLRRSGGKDDFTREIVATFKQAIDSAPSIVFLDDMDKFADSDENHRNAGEYIAVQTCIDRLGDKRVFVIATVNDPDLLPESLVRPGRFDIVFDINKPNFEDGSAIIAHHLSNKKLAPGTDMDDIIRMMDFSSCAVLDTVINESAMRAAYARRSSIEISDITDTVLNAYYGGSGCIDQDDPDELARTALHEAGHLTVAEALCPDCVGLASIRSGGVTRGFIHQFREHKRRAHVIATLLAGKAAVELYHSHTAASGCVSDIKRAKTQLTCALNENAVYGFGFVDVSSAFFKHTSEATQERTEAVVQSELERYMRIARDILIQNRAFLENTAARLLDKGVLLYSDIKAIKAVTPLVTCDI